MINIDGSTGEAGGQILRSALGLSALTGKAFSITKIRAKRNTPGLKQQHLQSVNAMAKICDAEVEGAREGSSSLSFRPSDITSGTVRVSIPTAGSVGLVLQALLLPAVHTKLKIKIEGGATYGKWAVPMDHLQNVVFPILSRMGYKVRVEDLKEGFFPKGGARVTVISERIKQLDTINLIEKGKIIGISGKSIASSFLKNARVAERQSHGAKRIISESFGLTPNIENAYYDTLCPGSGIQLWVKTENSVIGANSLGQRGIMAENVGKDSAKKLITEHDRGTVDTHTADQLLPYFALAGGGKLQTGYITNHIITNAWVIEKFLDVKFDIDKKIIACKKI